MKLNLDISQRIFIIMLLIWLDMGATYITLTAAENQKVKIIQVNELSFTAGPLIERFGITVGLIIAGLINTVIIIFMCTIFNGEMEHGMIKGILIFVVMLNLRLTYIILSIKPPIV